MSFWSRLFGRPATRKPQRLDYLNEAMALERVGDLAGAITSYRLGLRDNPNDLTILQNIAIAFSKTGQVEEAIRHYRRAWAIDPTSCPASLRTRLPAAEAAMVPGHRTSPGLSRLPSQGARCRALGASCETLTELGAAGESTPTEA
jgi:tetratricopeptide (TPR) repeat protein